MTFTAIERRVITRLNQIVDSGLSDTQWNEYNRGIERIEEVLEKILGINGLKKEQRTSCMYSMRGSVLKFLTSEELFDPETEYLTVEHARRLEEKLAREKSTLRKLKRKFSKVKILAQNLEAREKLQELITQYTGIDYQNLELIWCTRNHDLRVLNRLGILEGEQKLTGKDISTLEALLQESSDAREEFVTHFCPSTSVFNRNRIGQRVYTWSAPFKLDK